ncbi:MAG: 50S ribosomal protein L3 [Cyanobacteria bacterium J06641_5]
MTVGLIGHKLGMTQVFDGEEGTAVPVTVLQVGPCVVTQVKTAETDGYSAVQVGYKEVREKLLTKPELGHLSKSDAPPLRHLKEYQTGKPDEYKPGDRIGADIFSVGQLVDVRGKSIGRGFAGNQRRNNFSRGLMTHGCKNHRLPGSIGPGTTPGRVYPGRKMAGRMGNANTTIRKLKVVRVYEDRNLILVKGSVPGKPGGVLSVVASNVVGEKA